MSALFYGMGRAELVQISVYVRPIVKKRIKKRKADQGVMSDSEYVRSLILKDIGKK